MVIANSRCQLNNMTHSHFLCKQDKRQNIAVERFLVAGKYKVDCFAALLSWAAASVSMDCFENCLGWTQKISIRCFPLKAF